MSSGPADSFPRLLGDVGGTSARFALQSATCEPISETRTFACADYASLAEMMEKYLATTPARRPRWCALGIANPITGDLVRMTNHDWSFSIAELKARLGFEELLVLNDFTALALALPVLDARDVAQVGGGTPRRGAPIALLGPGTGLGMSGLIPCCNGEYIPLASEGGHITLAASDDREAEIIARLRRRHDHVSAERLLSGPGLVDLYEICAAMQGGQSETLNAAQIKARGIDDADPACVLALATFCSMLGTLASDLALILSALGGVYIGGGIVPKLGDFFARSQFRARFEKKGRFTDYLAQIPSYVIHAPYPALLGAARALERLERGAR